MDIIYARLIKVAAGSAARRRRDESLAANVTLYILNRCLKQCVLGIVIYR